MTDKLSFNDTDINGRLCELIFIVIWNQDQTGLNGEQDTSEGAAAVFEEKRVIDMGNTGERPDHSNTADEAENECEFSDEAGEEEVFEKPYFFVMWKDWGLIKYTINDQTLLPYVILVCYELRSAISQ